MAFHPIDLETWPRRPYYEHYTQRVRCLYSVTSDIDITELLPYTRAQGYKFYAAYIAQVAKVVNSEPFRNLRYSLNQQGQLGYYDALGVSYIIFHEDDETFSSVYTPYDPDFSTFYDRLVEDMLRYKDVKGLVLNEHPRDIFRLSCSPWLTYSALHMAVEGGDNQLAPFVSWGKYSLREGRIQLPLTFQIHHSVCDGYHTGKFYQAMQQIASNPQLHLPKRAHV